jgi:transposase-like protein
MASGEAAAAVVCEPRPPRRPTCAAASRRSYGAKVSGDTISRLTDAVVEELTAWQSRPLDAVYPVVFIDAIHVKIRDGKVANRPVYIVVDVTVNGERDILGLWSATAVRENCAPLSEPHRRRSAVL